MPAGADECRHAARSYARDVIACRAVSPANTRYATLSLIAIATQLPPRDAAMPDFTPMRSPPFRRVTAAAP